MRRLMAEGIPAGASEVWRMEMPGRYAMDRREPDFWSGPSPMN